MRRISYLVAVALLAALASALQDTVRLERVYKTGDMDSYSFALAMTTGGGSVDLSMKVTHIVKKVDEDGVADVEMQFADLAVVFNDQEMNPPAPPSLTLRVTKHGLPVGQKLARGQGQSMNLVFLRYLSLVPDQAVKVGEKVDMNFTDPENSKTRVTGDFSVESVRRGEAKTVSHLEISVDGMGQVMRMVRTAWFDVKTGKLKRAEGTVSNLAGGPEGLGAVDAIQFTYERAK
ncbi:MAG: hypothetical protein IH851_07240 [Armatimonadetes bacterium]|nr:hypothetical protein [Armatimonadota bacterium]